MPLRSYPDVLLLLRNKNVVCRARKKVGLKKGRQKGESRQTIAILKKTLTEVFVYQEK